MKKYIIHYKISDRTQMGIVKEKEKLRDKVHEFTSNQKICKIIP